MKIATFKLSLDHHAVIVSPHCDDMAFSLGGSLLGSSLGPNPLIVNVFNVTFFTRIESEYGNIELTTRRRKNEELRAGAKVGAQTLFIDLAEYMIRNPDATLERAFNPDFIPEQDPVFKRVLKALLALHNQHPDAHWLFPLAVGSHVDHIIVRNVGCYILSELPDSRIGFYEDLPYAAVHPADRMAEHASKLAGVGLQPVRLGIQPAVKKIELLMTYESQVGVQEVKALLDFHSRVAYETVWTAGKSLGLFIAR